MTKKLLTLFVEFRVEPKDVTAFKDALRPVWAACAAEPECLFFRPVSGPADAREGSGLWRCGVKVGSGLRR
jgi:quinol monooxygenase YgiN